MAVFNLFGNEVLYAIRKSFPNLRPHYKETPSAISQNLLRPELLNLFSAQRAQVSLFYTWILSHLKTLDQISLPADQMKAIDIGSLDFAYAPALCHFLHQKSARFELTGLEFDPYAFYANLYRRGQAGQYAAELCQKFYSASSINYRAGNWLEEDLGLFDIGFLFFPFLYSDLHKRFRLPKCGFDPMRFYQKAIETCQFLVLLHQGDRELEESLRTLKRFSGEVLEIQRFDKNPWQKREFPVAALVYQSPVKN